MRGSWPALIAALALQLAAADDGVTADPAQQGQGSTEVDTGAKTPDALRSTALLYFQALIAGVPEAVAELSSYPFNLDGTEVSSRAELTRRLREAFGQTDLSRSTFYGIRVFPGDQMKEEHGSPPARLGELNLDGAWVVVANLGGHGYVAVFREENGIWRSVAYTE